MCYTQRKIEGGVGALRDADDTNFLKPNGQSRNLNIYGSYVLTFVRLFYEYPFYCHRILVNGQSVIC